MGTYVGLYKVPGAKIPMERRIEFEKRLEQLFRAAGMMRLQSIQLYGRQLEVIQQVDMSNGRYWFNYNYFGDDWQEAAGYDPEEGCVWSGKVGYRQFCRAMITAHVLEEMYTEGIAAAMINSTVIDSWGYVGWLNYLFDEKKHMKNFDPWKLYEAMHKDERDRGSYYNFGDDGYAFIGKCEIQAIRYGTEKVINEYIPSEEKVLQKLVLNQMKDVVSDLKKYKEEWDADTIMQLIRAYYEKNDKGKQYGEKGSFLIARLILTDAPGFVTKAVAELYDKEFWTLWEKIQDVVERKNKDLYGKEGYYILPVRTNVFFGVEVDDMIPFWKENGQTCFSDIQWEWFAQLKKRYDILLESGITIEKPIRYIWNLMIEVKEKFSRVYTFESFWEESMDYVMDQRYMILWKIYDELLHSDGTRKQLRKYMALVANIELRKKVFGF